jgi:hypothetical protein
MSASKIAVYAGDVLGPSNIAKNLNTAKQAGWTTIILGLFHIGYPPGQDDAEIFFNDSSIIDGGKYTADPDWPATIAQLKQNCPITYIYASIGGGYPVQDFSTIQTIYEKNNNSFNGTLLERNLQVFRNTFPAIDGIDMDNEDATDRPSFVAFCRMAIEMGFSITFCPYNQPDLGFWIQSLAEIEKSNKGAVKWWNLQCYAGGTGNDPQAWADAIAEANIPGFSTHGFILAGDWTRFWNQGWQGDCPPWVNRLMSQFSKEPCFGGGFLWDMDAILKWGPDPDGCGSSVGTADYVNAIREAMKTVPPKS